MQIITRSVRNCAISMITMCLLLAAALPLFAADVEFDPISTEMLMDMLGDKKEFTLIDARTKEEYQEAHIGTSVNITERDFDKLADTLPLDKKTLLVLYCNGVKCGKSKKVALKAKAAGYGNILIYSEGFPVWEEKGLPIVAGPDYAKKIATTKMSALELEKVLREKRDAYVLVDVRDEFEFAEGHIPGAINIPAATLAANSGMLPKDKGIIVYCNSGGGSYMGYRKIVKLGYPNIFQAIFAEWKEAGFPVEKSKP